MERFTVDHRRTALLSTAPMTRAMILGVGLFTIACAGTGTTTPSAKAGVEESKQIHGLTVQRPEEWRFSQPDSNSGPDTVVTLIGPLGSHDTAPVLNIARRALDWADQQRNPTHLLTVLVLEFMQRFPSAQGSPEPTELVIAGRRGVNVALTFEEIVNSAAVQRRAHFYGLVDGEQVWMIHSLGPVSATVDAAIESIVTSITFESD